MNNFRLIKNKLGEYGILGEDDVILPFPTDPGLPYMSIAVWGTREQAEYGIQQYEKSIQACKLRNEYEVVK